MAEEIDLNLKINSDLFPSFIEGFSAYPEGTPIEEQIYSDKINRTNPNAVLTLCCNSCTCTVSHSDVPSVLTDAASLNANSDLKVCCDLCICTNSHSSIPAAN
jgi:hypothetical protein